MGKHIHILFVLALSNDEGSGEDAQMCRLARAFRVTAREHKALMYAKMKTFIKAEALARI